MPEYSPAFPYIETLGVVATAVVGVLAGAVAGRQRSPWWVIGYLVPLVLLVLIGVGRWLTWLEFAPPFEWLMSGRTEYAVLAFAVPLILGTPAPRLRIRRQRILVWLFAGVVVASFSIPPFLLPALHHGEFAAMATTVDADGVCLQSNGYTCGPAAAVTALRALGVDAEEGELAILAHTSPAAGTPPDSLCNAITRRFAAQNVHTEYRVFGDVGELRGREPVIAVVKYSFLIDHYVTVLEVRDGTLIVGDPLVGRQELPTRAFVHKWRRTGIIITRGGG